MGARPPATRRRGEQLPVQLLPVVWGALALVAGPGAAEALDGWSPAPQTMAGVLLWAAWAVGLLAALVPRPAGLVVLRTQAALFVVLSAVAAPSTGAVGAAALGGCLAAAALALLPATGARFVNGSAYGSERRFPLRVPPALLYGPLPLAVLVVGAGAVTGPLFLADRRVLPGLGLTALGWPAAAAAGRSLSALSQRWAVLVPAGIVLKDPLTLLDPFLFLRDRVAGLRPLPYAKAPASDVVDLRLGAVKGSLVLELSGEAAIARSRGRQRGGAIVNARRIAFTPTDPAGLLADAGSRRIVAAG